MSVLPDVCGIAFKEWAGVCEALLDGRQTLIVRKGGIREDAGRFTPEHRVFWLYPTHSHEAQQGLREGDRQAVPDPGSGPFDPVSLRALAKVELIRYVDSEDVLPALTPFHVWTFETILKRFSYRHPGLWVLGVRMFRRDSPWTLVPSAEQLGCKSWVVLESPLATAGLRPVLDEEAWSEQMRLLRTVLWPDAGTG